MTYHTELAVIINIRTKVATQGNLRKKTKQTLQKQRGETRKRGLCFLMVCPHRTEIERRGGERNGYRCLSSVSWHLVFGEEDGWDGCGCTS
jgi:hypothetical protein